MGELGALTFAPVDTRMGVQGISALLTLHLPPVRSPSQECLALLHGGKARQSPGWLSEKTTASAPQSPPTAQKWPESRLSEVPKSLRSQDLITGLGFGCFKDSLLFGCLFYWGSRLRCCYELKGGPCCSITGHGA